MNVRMPKAPPTKLPGMPLRPERLLGLPLRADRLVETIRDCKDREQVVRVLSDHVRRRTTGRCIPAMLITLQKRMRDPHLRDCGSLYSWSGNTSAVASPHADEWERSDLHGSPQHVILRTTTGCDLSGIGLRTEGNYIEISSNTVDSQKRKGYNSIMRAIAVMIAGVEDKWVRSQTANHLSAYTLIKTYQNRYALDPSITGDLNDQPRDDDPVHEPLTTEQAKEVMYDITYGDVPPTEENMDMAARMSAECMYHINCAR